MAITVSAELVYMFMPVIVYWVYSGLCELIAWLGIAESYRLHSKEDEERRNIPSRREVVKYVLIQQAEQMAISLILFMLTKSDGDAEKPEPPLSVRAIHFLVAMVIMDSYQYWAHRFMHLNKFMYKHVHSKYHGLLVPYSYGANYNHPFEGFSEYLGGTISVIATGMTPATAAVFFSFANMKAVNDHCGFMIPWHPVHRLRLVDSAFHDTHHQLYGNKYNFSNPFFSAWDKVMGTYLPYSIEKREDGGLQAKPIKKD